VTTDATSYAVVRLNRDGAVPKRLPIGSRVYADESAAIANATLATIWYGDRHEAVWIGSHADKPAHIRALGTPKETTR
jgi:hypothetical protein